MNILCKIHQTAKVDFIVPAITLASNIYKKPVRIVIISLIFRQVFRNFAISMQLTWESGHSFLAIFVKSLAAYFIS